MLNIKPASALKVFILVIIPLNIHHESVSVIIFAWLDLYLEMFGAGFAGGGIAAQEAFSLSHCALSDAGPAWTESIQPSCF